MRLKGGLAYQFILSDGGTVSVFADEGTEERTTMRRWWHGHTYL